MSEIVDTSEFTSQGHEPFPSLYADNLQVASFTEWTTDTLLARITQYREFITTSELPHHKSIAERIIRHAFCELNFRIGDTDE